MDGYAVGAQCIRNSAEATASACAAVSGVTSGGVVSCEAPSLTGRTVSYTLVTDGTTRTTRPATLQLQECVPVDLEEFGPVIGAWVVALVVILCARSIYTKVFNRESY